MNYDPNFDCRKCYENVRNFPQVTWKTVMFSIKKNEKIPTFYIIKYYFGLATNL